MNKILAPTCLNQLNATLAVISAPYSDRMYPGMPHISTAGVTCYIGAIADDTNEINERHNPSNPAAISIALPLEIKAFGLAHLTKNAR